MRGIWDDAGMSDEFVEAFKQWARDNGASIEDVTRSALFCEFPGKSDRTRKRLGVYEADGRHMLRFDTVREEVEVKLLTQFKTTETTLTVQSDKGSREFYLDAATDEWAVTKEPI
jgi:hypothetical protein